MSDPIEIDDFEVPYLAEPDEDDEGVIDPLDNYVEGHG